LALNIAECLCFVGALLRCVACVGCLAMMCRIDPDADGHSKADSGSQGWEVTNVCTSPLMDQVQDTNIVFGERGISLTLHNSSVQHFGHIQLIDLTWNVCLKGCAAVGLVLLPCDAVLSVCSLVVL
jgi:acetaldehyde dehydrogenase (acetylating)